MRNAAKRKRRAATGIDKRADVAGAEDLLVVQRNIFEQGQKIDFLLIPRADQVVIRLTGDRENRCAVHFRVVQTIQQVYRPGSRCGEAHAEPPGVLRVSTRHERGGFLVPYLQKRDAVLAGAQRFHDAVDAVAGQAEDDADTPVNQSLHQHIGRGLRHVPLLALTAWVELSG